jgi:hypothetical protein
MISIMKLVWDALFAPKPSQPKAPIVPDPVLPKSKWSERLEEMQKLQAERKARG